MTRPGGRTCVLAVLLIVVALAAAALGAESPRPELPLGPFVRPGRPVVVRVPGADRVRFGSSPWALPQGAEGDEFVVQTLDAGLGPFVLEIYAEGKVHRVALAVETLPRAGKLRAVFGPTDPPGTYAVPTTALPTIPEAWLLFDAVDEPPVAVSGPSRDALSAHRERAGASAAVWCEPLLDPPAPHAFRLMAAAAERAPTLRQDVVWAAFLAAGTVVLLLGLRRFTPGAARLAWAAVPGALLVAWALVGDVLPGHVRAHAVVFEGPGRRLVLVRVAAIRPTAVDFAMPEGAGSPALLRFAPSDTSTSSAEVGRTVHFELGAGEHRVLAYSLSNDGISPSTTVARADPVGGAVERFLTARGLVLTASEAGSASDALPTAPGVAVVPAAVHTVQLGN